MTVRPADLPVGLFGELVAALAALTPRQRELWIDRYVLGVVAQPRERALLWWAEKRIREVLLPLLPPPRLKPDGHGVAGYRRGCKCGVCRAAHAARAREYAQRRRVAA